jgi:hypothetical protein
VWRDLLQTSATQFGYLYTFHPKTCTGEEIKGLVSEVMTRHKRDAEAVWVKAGMMSQQEMDAAQGRVGAGLGAEGTK